jgi:hypothetical protein
VKAPPPEPLDIAPTPPPKRIRCPRGCGAWLLGANDPHACTRSPDAVAAEVAAKQGRHLADPPPRSTDRDRAARWTLFAAHALQGLLANPSLENPAGGQWEDIAALYADEMIAEHDRRFDVFGRHEKKEPHK